MLEFEHPTILILVAVCFAFLLAVFMYRKDARFSSASPIIKILLTGLRFTSLSILIILLFKPKWLNETKQLEKPIVVFLQDASSSILNYPDSAYYNSEFKNLIEKNNNTLSNKFDVFSYHFSNKVKNGIRSVYDGKTTDIAHALNEVSNRFYNRNLAAVILASDGNYTQGMNPYYVSSEVNCPIFTLGVGREFVEPDLQIKSIRHNEIAYFENEFPIQFDILSNFDTDQKHQINIRHKGKTIYNEDVNLKPNIPLSKKLFIEATNEGIQYYDLIINSFEGEKNTENNSHKIAIEVLNNLQNILILSSSAHPDIAALKSALEDGKTYKVKSALFHEFDEEIEPYNLIILHQIPDFTNRNEKLLDHLIASETSLLFIGGNSSNWTKFNTIQNVVEIKTKNSVQELLPLINDDFSPFELSKKCKDFIESSPPLLAPFGDVLLKEQSSTLFKQIIKGIKTDKELLFFTEKGEKQFGILLAEGLWKWKLFDYQNNESHDNFNELIQTISQYLTLNKDKRKLRLQYPKIITEGNPFHMEAQLYNDNYKLIEDAELSLELIDASGKKFIYNFNPMNTKFQARIMNLNKGMYQFKVSSTYKQQYLEESGSFAVLESKLEQQQQEANWKTLKQLSGNTNGVFIEKENFNNYADIITSNINSNHKVYFNQSLSDLIKQKSIFFVLLLCLFLEWIIRKRLGTH